MEAVRNVESEVRELIRRTGLDPSRDTREVDRLVRDAVADYDERSLHGGLPTLPDVEGAVKSVLDAVAGFGPLQRYFDAPDIEEICIRGRLTGGLWCSPWKPRQARVRRDVTSRHGS